LQEKEEQRAPRAQPSAAQPSAPLEGLLLRLLLAVQRQLPVVLVRHQHHQALQVMGPVALLLPQLQQHLPLLATVSLPLLRPSL
jgi:hypothetical protein